MDILRKVTIWMLLCALLITLGGCAPSAKSEVEIVADIKAEFLSEEYPDCSLVSFDIEKRATDSKNGTDSINAKVIIEKENGIAEGTLHLNINYKLYDNGWQLENCAKDEEDDTKGIFRAKSAVELTQEDAISELEKQYGMGEITAISFSESTDLENELQECSIEFKEEHTYVTYTKRVNFQRGFNPFTGNWQEVIPVNTYVISEDWDISGTYFGKVQRESTNYEANYGDYDVFEYKVIFESSELSDAISLKGEYSTGTYNPSGARLRGSGITKGGGKPSSNLEKLYEFSNFQEILATTVFEGRDYRGSGAVSYDSLAYKIANNGYRVKTNVERPIKYFALYNNSHVFGMRNLFFFGEDFIGICQVSEGWATKDDLNKTYTYNICELIPQN